MHAWAEVCHLSQSSTSVLTGFLCSIGWRIIEQTRLSSNTSRTPTVFLIQQSCAIHTFHCQVIFEHAYTWGITKEAIVLPLPLSAKWETGDWTFWNIIYCAVNRQVLWSVSFLEWIQSLHTNPKPYIDHCPPPLQLPFSTAPHAQPASLSQWWIELVPHQPLL